MIRFDGTLAGHLDLFALMGVLVSVFGAVAFLRARSRTRDEGATVGLGTAFAVSLPPVLDRWRTVVGGGRPSRDDLPGDPANGGCHASGARRPAAGPAHGNGSDEPQATPERRPTPDPNGAGSKPAAESLLEVLRRLGPDRELGRVLQGIVDAVGESFGFERSMLRIYNPRTELFEARAFHGCGEDLVQELSNRDVRLEEWAAMARRAGRVGNSYRVAAADTEWPDRLAVDPKDGRPAGEKLLVVPMRGEEGHALGYLVLAPADCEDVSVVANLEILAFQAVLALEASRLRARLERRELELSVVSEQMKDWETTRDNFVANVSHELRTPLTSIKAYAETLQRSHVEMDDTTRREFVDVILHEAERLNQVFDDLLDVAHLEGGRRRELRDRVNLSATIDQVCQRFGPQFAEKGVQLRGELPPEPLLVQGDSEGLRQVVSNLVANALKFTPERGVVQVSLREETGTARVTVEDTGIGVPEHELSRIFDRFYQVDGSSTRAYGGQGLGLSISKDIIGWHHGRIWAENRRDGGARFVFTLPVRGLVVRQTPEEVGIGGAERLQWEAFLRLSTTLVCEIMGTRVASIMLVDGSEDVLRIEAAVGLDEEIVQNSVVSPGEGLAGTVWKTGESMIAPDPRTGARASDPGQSLSDRPRSLLSAPIWGDDRVLGVVNVNSKANGRHFDDDDRLLLEAMAERIVRALESFESYRVEYRRLASVEGGVRAMLEVGRERRSHLREFLVRTGVQTGRELGLDREHLRALAYSLRTYDLGLAQVSAQVLRKVAPLTREERARIEDHVHFGSDMVAELEPSPKVRKMILHHHENVDGSGYPEGLQGEAIPVGARVIRLVDALSALLHDRPFRPAMGLEEALDLIEEGIGRRFCPRVTPLFLGIVRQHEGLVRALRPDARLDGYEPSDLGLEDLRIHEH